MDVTLLGIVSNFFVRIFTWAHYINVITILLSGVVSVVGLAIIVIVIISGSSYPDLLFTYGTAICNKYYLFCPGKKVEINIDRNNWRTDAMGHDNRYGKSFVVLFKNMVWNRYLISLKNICQYMWILYSKKLC